MSRTTEMITTTEIKSLAIVDANIDTAYFDQYILMTQRKYIKPFLGVDFYDELTTQIAGASLTTANDTLLDDYIKPALAHYVVYVSLPQLRSQVAKGGVFLNLSDTADAVSDLGYGQIRDDYLAKAETFIDEIDNYIKEYRKTNTNAYPLYCGKQSQNGGIILY